MSDITLSRSSLIYEIIYQSGWYIPELEVLGMGSLLGSGMQICGIGRLDGTIADFEGD